MKLKRKLGIDVGNGYTKYSGGKFASKIEVGAMEEPHGEIHSVNFRGVEYIVGSPNGSAVIEEDKYFSDSYLILLLTGIALSEGNESNSIDAEVVVGVPANQYNKEQRDAIKKHLTGITETVWVDGNKFDITLKAVEVFMEGSLPIKTNDTEKVLVIDVGAGTINAVLWDDKRKVHDYTYEESFISLYITMSDILNKQYKMKTTPQGVEKYVGVDSIKIKGAMKPVPEMKLQLEKFITACAGSIQKNQKLESMTCDKVVVMGGGAKKTFQYFKKAFPHAVPVDNSQFINQQVYELVAKVKFKA